jgi:hypothetical protein
VALYEIVNKPMSLAARTGDVEAFKANVEQAVLKKTKQLDGTAALLQRDPQPAASPLKKPATRAFPIVVCGGHFPLDPVTRNHIEECLNSTGILQHPGIEPLAIIDLDELEAFASLAKAGELLPDVLIDWLGGSFGKGSFTIYMWAVHGGRQLTRPPVVAASLQDAIDAIRPLLGIRDAEDGQEQLS